MLRVVWKKKMITINLRIAAVYEILKQAPPQSFFFGTSPDDAFGQSKFGKGRYS